LNKFIIIRYELCATTGKNIKKTIGTDHIIQQVVNSETKIHIDYNSGRIYIKRTTTEDADCIKQEIDIDILKQFVSCLEEMGRKDEFIQFVKCFFNGTLNRDNIALQFLLDVGAYYMATDIRRVSFVKVTYRIVPNRSTPPNRTTPPFFNSISTRGQ